MSNTDGYWSLGADINKVQDPRKLETKEGPQTLLPELELSMDDSELVKLSKKWRELWSPVWQSKIKPKCDKNETYWKGETQKEYGEGFVQKNEVRADNVIFESVETLLPMITRQNPDPVVTSDNTTEGNKLADKVKLMLVDVADKVSLKIQLKQVSRYWLLYQLGAAKIGWNSKKNNIDFLALRPHKLILDPNATIINGEYTGEFIGEYRKDTAARLVIRFPKKKSLISEMVDGEMGTEVTYVEWWTDDYVFWTVKIKGHDEVLGKHKNPHWNYDGEKEVTDEFGNVSSQKITGRNHFTARKKPYIFFSVFNLGLSPFDETGLIQQCISIQDMINKRLAQIDKNADATNGGIVVSGDHFTKEQAGRAAQTLQEGGAIFVPSGDVRASYARDMAPPLPPFVYQSLQDYRATLKQIIGVAGSIGPQAQQRTVRGKIMAKTSDTDRIGGGISEYLEQFADVTYNWFVQMMMVYYDEPHTASVLGKQRAIEYITLVNSEMSRDIAISVREGSLLPKDSMSKRNEAVELWGAGALDPITLFERLEFADPYASAKQMFIWRTAPQMLFPDLMQQANQPGQGNPPAPPGASMGQQPPMVEGEEPLLPKI